MKRRGFTLIELIIVMSILGILAGIAIAQMQKAPLRAREAALRENLFTFRSCLDQFYADRGRYPESLEELVTEKYIRKIPNDPFTKSADTWVIEFETPDPSQGATDEPPGIIDVKSGSTALGYDGTPVNAW